ncbi:hypothetical protein [Sulfuriferula plumbiphila]|uniref:hypothetical protein n=1 Tax=Sulfuriferula plumbiphila TaxID=171865 RepID=UPI0011BFCD95|nr:hypothetical protein [Sulfuriferula plumbiphila]
MSTVFFTVPSCVTWNLKTGFLSRSSVGGAAPVMVEATAVTPEGRISAGEMRLWSEQHRRALAPIPQFIKEHGTGHRACAPAQSHRH